MLFDQTVNSTERQTHGAGDTLCTWQPSLLDQLSSSLGALFGGTSSSARPNDPHGPQVLDLGALLGAIRDFAAGLAPRRELSRDSFDVETSKGTRCEGSVSAYGITARGEADASAYARARGDARSSMGPDGIDAEGTLEARAGVTAGVEGSVCSDLGGASGAARATAEAYGRVHGRGHVGLDGADIKADASVGAFASATANARVATAPVLGMTAEAQADARAESGTGAQATGEAVLTLNPPQALVQGKAGAFAGARASVSAEAGVGPVKAQYGAEARAGIGADASFEAGVKGGKLSIDFGLGAALGIGLGFNLHLEVDVKPITDVIGSIFGAVAGLFGGGKGDGSHAAKQVGDFVQSLGAATQPGRAPTQAGTPEWTTWSNGNARTWSGTSVHTTDEDVNTRSIVEEDDK